MGHRSKRGDSIYMVIASLSALGLYAIFVFDHYLQIYPNIGFLNYKYASIFLEFCMVVFGAAALGLIAGFFNMKNKEYGGMDFFETY